jgi:hypothetical protein
MLAPLMVTLAIEEKKKPGTSNRRTARKARRGEHARYSRSGCREHVKEKIAVPNGTGRPEISLVGIDALSAHLRKPA